jgi:uncharacterized protein YukE
VQTSKCGERQASSAVTDFSMDYKDISERIALLMQEIRDLQGKNAQFCKGNGNARDRNRTAHDARELRLQQIKEELAQMMRMRTDRHS